MGLHGECEIGRKHAGDTHVNVGANIAVIDNDETKDHQYNFLLGMLRKVPGTKRTFTIAREPFMCVSQVIRPAKTSDDLGRQAYRNQAKTSLCTVDVTLHESSRTVASMADDCSRLF